jgi:hypothetical protein
MRRSGVQVLYPAPFRWIPAAYQTNAMKVSVEFLLMFAGRVAMLSLLSGVLVSFVTVWDGLAVARAAGAETLPAAQTQLRYARKSWRALSCRCDARSNASRTQRTLSRASAEEGGGRTGQG